MNNHKRLLFITILLILGCAHQVKNIGLFENSTKYKGVSYNIKTDGISLREFICYIEQIYSDTCSLREIKESWFNYLSQKELKYYSDVQPYRRNLEITARILNSKNLTVFTLDTCTFESLMALSKINVIACIITTKYTKKNIKNNYICNSVYDYSAKSDLLNQSHINIIDKITYNEKDNLYKVIGNNRIYATGKLHTNIKSLFLFTNDKTEYSKITDILFISPLPYYEIKSFLKEWYKGRENIYFPKVNIFP